MLAFILVAIVLVVVGVVLRITVLLTIAYSIFWCGSVTIFVVLSILMPVGVVMSDSCDFLYLVKDNVTEHLPQSAVFTACMLGGLLLIHTM